MTRSIPMRSKYFLRRLRVHLLLITLPILSMGIITSTIARRQLSNELSSYAEKTKTYLLNILTDELSVFDDDIALFSNSPMLDRSLQKLMNKEKLNYKDSVYKALIPTIISTSANVNTIIDSVYVYYDNPNGNYFSSLFGYTNINSHPSDTEWLDMYRSSDAFFWFAPRSINHYAFDSAKNVLSYFHRLDNPDGIIVINYLTDALAQIIDINQIYNQSVTLLLDSKHNILVSNSDDITQLAASAVEFMNQPNDDSSHPYRVISVGNTSCIAYTSSINKYNLNLLFLVPEKEVYQIVHTMIFCFILIIGLSIILSITLSIIQTTHNFRQLTLLLELFSQPNGKPAASTLPRAIPRNEYDLIFNNILNTFVQNNTLRLNLIQSQLQEKDAQIAALQLQLNPHFIFNTLQAVDMEILKNNPFSNNASMLIHHLSAILEYSLRNSFHKVAIRDEIEICKQYVEIQKFRYSNPFLVYWEYDETVLENRIIHLILQPLIENCLHHGIKEAPRKGLIKVKIQKWNGRLHFAIIDNGMGIAKDRLKQIQNQLASAQFQQVSHIGLFNTNLRLQLTYDTESRISVHSKGGMGTAVTFSIPITEK